MRERRLFYSTAPLSANCATPGGLDEGCRPDLPKGGLVAKWRGMKSQPINSLLHHAFGIKGYRHMATHFEEGEIVFEVEPERPPKGVKGAAWVRHGYRWRKVRSLSIGLKAVWIKVKIQRWLNNETGAEIEHSPPLPAPTAK